MNANVHSSRLWLATLFAMALLALLTAAPALAQMDDLDDELGGIEAELDDGIGDGINDGIGAELDDETAGGIDADSATPVGTVPEIAVAAVVEDGEHLILATVTIGDTPIEGVAIGFYVQRTFGLMKLGEDVTLDDGTAAAPFPEGLPGTSAGELAVVAKVLRPPEYAGVVAHALVLGGAVPHDSTTTRAARALWSPQTPWGLLLTIVILVGIVWSVYLFVIVQLFRLRGAAEPAE